jgi:hypothetical protein
MRPGAPSGTVSGDSRGSQPAGGPCCQAAPRRRPRRPAQARKHCRATEAVVAEFKAGAASIEALCRGVAEGLLVDAERRRVYELPEFEAVQAEHHKKARARSGGRALVA